MAEPSRSLVPFRTHARDGGTRYWDKAFAIESDGSLEYGAPVGGTASHVDTVTRPRASPRSPRGAGLEVTEEAFSAAYRAEVDRT